MTIELYDLGQTTHRLIPGLYEFIIERAGEYVTPDLARQLAEHARNRIEQNASTPQEPFSAMCRIWVEACRRGAFHLNPSDLVFPDTIPRFQAVKRNGREVGVLTSGSSDFTTLLYDVAIPENGCLAGLVDRYFLGEEVGDKDYPETFERLWQLTDGGIYAVFDDKLTVCVAAAQGLKAVDGSARIYLVDRNGIYNCKALEDMAKHGIQKIASFAEVQE